MINVGIEEFDIGMYLAFQDKQKKIQGINSIGVYDFQFKEEGGQTENYITASEFDKFFPSEHVLVIKGKHGIGKTAFLSSIVKAHDEGRYFKDEFDFVIPVGDDYIHEEEKDIFKFMRNKCANSKQSYKENCIMNLTEKEMHKKSDRTLWCVDDFDKLDKEKALNVMEKINKKDIKRIILFTSSEINNPIKCKTLELMGLKNNNKFIFNYFKDQSHLAGKLTVFLSGYPEGRSILANREYLIATCKILETQNEISFGQLYKKLLDVIFSDPNCLTLNRPLKKFFKKIGLHLHRGNSTHILVEEIEQIYQELIKEESIYQKVITEENITYSKIFYTVSLNRLLELGLMRKTLNGFTFIYKDILDYFGSFLSVDEFIKNYSKFSNMVLFMCNRLKKKQINSLFLYLFTKEPLSSSSSFPKEMELKASRKICLFLNEINYDANKQFIKEILKRMVEDIGLQAFIDASQKLNHNIFKHLKLPSNEALIDQCLIASINGDKRIVDKLFKKKQSMKSSSKVFSPPPPSVLRGVNMFDVCIKNTLKREWDVNSNNNDDNGENVPEKWGTFFSWETILDMDCFEKNQENDEEGTWKLSKCAFEKDIYGKSLIFHVSQRNQLEMLKCIYKTQKIKRVERDSLMEACRQGNLEIVKFFFRVIEQSGEKSISDYINEMELICLRDKHIIEYIISKIFAKNSNGGGGVGTLPKLLLGSVKYGKKKIVSQLIKNGADFGSLSNEGEPIFFQLFKNRVFNHDLFLLFQESNINFNAINTNGQNCMHIACSKGEMDLIKFLCSKGVFTNQIDDEQYSPLDHIKNVYDIDVLLKMGFRPNKDSSLYLLKKIIILNRPSLSKKLNIHPSTTTRTPLSNENILEEQVMNDIMMRLIDCLDSSKYKKAIKVFVDHKVKDVLIKMIIKRAQSHNSEFMNIKGVFEKLFNQDYKHIFLEMSISCSKVFIKTFKHFYLRDNMQYTKDIIQFNRNDFEKLALGLSQEQKNYIEHVEKIIDEETKQSKQIFQKFSKVIIDDYLTLKQEILLEDKVEKKNVIFLDLHGSSSISQLLNECLKKIIENIQKTPISAKINFKVVNYEMWEKERDTLDPWILFVSAEAHNDQEGSFIMRQGGGKEKTCIDSICKELLPEYKQKLGCVFLCVVDLFNRYGVVKREKDTKHLPPWLVEEVIHNHIDLEIFVSFFFHLMHSLVFEDALIKDACNKLTSVLNVGARIRVTESYNFSNHSNEYLFAKKRYLDKEDYLLQSGTYMNFRQEKPLKRGAYFCNFQKRKFSSKNIEYVTLFKKFSEMPFKKAISFYNGSPYSCSYRDSMNILDRVDKTCHPWMLIASISVSHNRIIIENENNKNENAQLSFVGFFDSITDKIGFLTCSIIFQQLHQKESNFRYNSVPTENTKDLLDANLTKELYECAEVVIINDLPIVEEDKKFFLESFFDKMNKDRCSIQKAFHLTEMAYAGSRFPMKMICRPIDYYFDKNTQRFFLPDINISTTIDQRVKEEKDLIKACNRLDIDHLKYLQSINTFGINSAIQDGRSLLLATLMKDLFEVAVVLLKYENINVNTIDPLSGNTPLHIACAKFRVSLVKSLIEKGAIINQLNFKTHSPMFYLYRFSRNFKEDDERSNRKMEEIFQLLMDAGYSNSEEKLGSLKMIGIDFEKMWKNREEGFPLWVEKMTQKMYPSKMKKQPEIITTTTTTTTTIQKDYPKKFFYEWDSSLVIPQKSLWNEILSDLESKQERLQPLHRKILYLNCNAKIDSMLSIREHLRYQDFEYNIIREFSENECVKKFIDIHFCSTLFEIKEALSKNNYWMIIFAGHASPEGIYMIDNNGDSNQFFTYSMFFDLLASNSPSNGNENNTKCVVFNACSTGEINPSRAFCRNKNVDFIISTQKVIVDSEGANFMFYFLKNLFMNEESIAASYRSTIHSTDLPFNLTRLEEKEENKSSSKNNLDNYLFGNKSNVLINEKIY